MNVQLTYFNGTGEYYTFGNYETEKESTLEIWHEIKEMLKQGIRPGLVDGHDGFHVLINVTNHIYKHPYLLIGAA